MWKTNMLALQFTRTWHLNMWRKLKGSQGEWGAAWYANDWCIKMSGLWFSRVSQPWLLSYDMHLQNGILLCLRLLRYLLVTLYCKRLWPVWMGRYCFLNQEKAKKRFNRWWKISVEKIGIGIYWQNKSDKGWCSKKYKYFWNQLEFGIDSSRS